MLRLSPAFAAACAVAATATLAAPGAAAPTLTRFATPAALPSGTTCSGFTAPVQARDGDMWFFGSNDVQPFRITPAADVIELPAPNALQVSCAGPAAAGTDGNIWASTFGGSDIVRFLPNGSGTAFDPGASNSNDLAAADDGNLWTAHQDGRNGLGRLTTDGVYTQFPPSGNTLPGSPGAITAGPDGNLWFTMFPSLSPGVTASGIGRITPAGSITVFTTEGLSPSDLVAGPDGNLWITQGAGQPVVRRTLDGTLTPFSDPAVPLGGNNRIEAGADGNLWISDPFNDRAIRLTPSGVFTPVPLGGTAFGGLGVGPDGALWFVQTDGLAYGRIDPEPAPKYSDTAQLQVPAAGTTEGPASRYPATINASGERGTVTGVTVRLNGLHHAYGADITAQLVGPQGQSALLMANATNRAGDLTTPRDVLGGEVITFKSGAPAAPRYLTSGVFDQIDGGGFAINFPAPAPASPTADLSVFNGTNPNGAWKLFVADDEGSFGTTGVIARGWSLDIQTTGVDTPAPPTPTTPPTTPPPTTPLSEAPAPPAQNQAPPPAAPPAGTPPAADTLAPKLTLGKLPTSVTLAALRKGITLRLTASETSTVRASLRARAKGKTRGSSFPVQLVLASRSVGTGPATRVVLKPSAKLLGSAKKTFQIQLQLLANDAAGNRATITRRLTVTVPRRR